MIPGITLDARPVISLESGQYVTAGDLQPGRTYSVTSTVEGSYLLPPKKKGPNPREQWSTAQKEERRIRNRKQRRAAARNRKKK